MQSNNLLNPNFASAWDLVFEYIDSATLGSTVSSVCRTFYVKAAETLERRIRHKLKFATALKNRDSFEKRDSFSNVIPNIPNRSTVASFQIHKSRHRKTKSVGATTKHKKKPKSFIVTDEVESVGFGTVRSSEDSGYTQEDVRDTPILIANDEMRRKYNEAASLAYGEDLDESPDQVNSLCEACKKKTFFLKMRITYQGRTWHTNCFECQSCNKLLDRQTVAKLDPIQCIDCNKKFSHILTGYLGEGGRGYLESPHKSPDQNRGYTTGYDEEKTPNSPTLPPARPVSTKSVEWNLSTDKLSKLNLKNSQNNNNLNNSNLNNNNLNNNNLNNNNLNNNNLNNNNLNNNKGLFQIQENVPNSPLHLDVTPPECKADHKNTPIMGYGETGQVTNIGYSQVEQLNNSQDELEGENESYKSKGSTSSNKQLSTKEDSSSDLLTGLDPRAPAPPELRSSRGSQRPFLTQDVSEFCAFCHDFIEPNDECVNFKDLSWHQECFTCETCQKAITVDQAEAVKENLPVCKPCLTSSNTQKNRTLPTVSLKDIFSSSGREPAPAPVQVPQSGSGSGQLNNINNNNHSRTNNESLGSSGSSFEDSSDEEVQDSDVVSSHYGSHGWRRFVWEKSFREILEIKNSEKKWRRLRNLATNFIYIAENYAKIIISECCVPTKDKRIPPTEATLSNPMGIAGGDKFICHGILFKFALDKELTTREGQKTYVYGDSEENQEAALKSANHELKGCMSFVSASEMMDTNIISFPLMAVIDYKGFRIVAISLVPIEGDRTLAYGSRDGGFTVMCSTKNPPNVKAVMAEYGKKMNLKEHTAGLLHTKQLYFPCDIEAHHVFRNDKHRIYVLDYARVLPPEAPPSHPEVKNRSPKGFLYNLLRPEFVIGYPKPLCSDAYSAFQPKNDPNKTINNTEVFEATKVLLRENLGKAIVVLKDKPLDSLEKNNELVQLIHQEGVNLRYLGWIYNRADKAKPLILAEMAARVLKNHMRHLFRCNMKEGKSATVEYQEIALDILRLLSSNIDKSNIQNHSDITEFKRTQDFWTNTEEVSAPPHSVPRHSNLVTMIQPLKVLLRKKYYRNCLPDFVKWKEGVRIDSNFLEENKLDEFDLDPLMDFFRLITDPKARLFDYLRKEYMLERFQTLTGLTYDPVFQQVKMQAVVKHLSLIDYAEGRLLKEQARNATTHSLKENYISQAQEKFVACNSRGFNCEYFKQLCECHILKVESMVRPSKSQEIFESRLRHNVTAMALAFKQLKLRMEKQSPQFQQSILIDLAIALVGAASKTSDKNFRNQCMTEAVINFQHALWIQSKNKEQTVREYIASRIESQKTDPNLGRLLQLVSFEPMAKTRTLVISKESTVYNALKLHTFTSLNLTRVFYLEPLQGDDANELDPLRTAVKLWGNSLLTLSCSKNCTSLFHPKIESAIELFCQCPKLTEIDFPAWKDIDNDVLKKFVEKCPLMSKVIIPDTSVTDIKCLKKLNNLHTIDVSGCSIPFSKLAFLHKIKTLKIARLNRVYFDPPEQRNLEGEFFMGLDILSLDNCVVAPQYPFTMFLTLTAQNCPTLKTLNLSSIFINPEEFDFCVQANLPMHTLNPIVQDQVLQEFCEHCPELSHVVLVGCPGIRTLGMLSKLKNLVLLNLSENSDLSESHVHDFLNTKNNEFSLSTLKLSKVNVTDEGLAALVSSRAFERLHTLELVGCRKITEKGVQHLLSSLGRLYRLNIKQTGVDLENIDPALIKDLQGSFRAPDNMSHLKNAVRAFPERRGVPFDLVALEKASLIELKHAVELLLEDLRHRDYKHYSQLRTRLSRCGLDPKPDSPIKWATLPDRNLLFHTLSDSVNSPTFTRKAFTDPPARKMLHSHPPDLEGFHGIDFVTNLGSRHSSGDPDNNNNLNNNNNSISSGSSGKETAQRKEAPHLPFNKNPSSAPSLQGSSNSDAHPANDLSPVVDNNNNKESSPKQ